MSAGRKTWQARRRALAGGMLMVATLLVAGGAEQVGAIPASAQIVTDLKAGAESALEDSSDGLLTDVNGTLFFSADDGLSGTELWKTDGTAAGTSLVKDIQPGAGGSRPSTLTNVNGTLFFSADDGVSGHEFWKSDGTTAGTVMVKDINPGPGSGGAGSLVAVGGALFFIADDGVSGSEMWKSDGTAAGTVLVEDINPGSAGSSSQLSADAIAGGVLFFAATDGISGRELWKTDGTPAGTVMVKDIRAGSFGSLGLTWLAGVNGTLFFVADDGIVGAEVWKSDGTAAGTVLVKDISAFSGPRYLTNVNGVLFFAATGDGTGFEPWKSDGTAAGTVMVKDIHPGPISSINDNEAANFVAVNGVAFFKAGDGTSGSEYWRSDGTAAGTVMVRDINPTGGSAFVLDYSLTEFEGLAYFMASDGTSGQELWRSDGTPAGTVRVADINPGSGDARPNDLTPSNGVLFFGAEDGTHGRELWRTSSSAVGELSLVSHLPTSPASTGNEDSQAPVISGDGRFVAFESRATNLVPGQIDSNTTGDIFLMEQTTGMITLVSHVPGNATTTGNAQSFGLDINVDGSFVTFVSAATDLVPDQSDTNAALDVFIFERATGEVGLVSHVPGSTTSTGNGQSSISNHYLSSNGAYVVFGSTATDLTPGQTDTNGVSDTFLFERSTGTMTLVSHIPGSNTTTSNNGTTGSTEISADASFVVFKSRSTDLVAGQTDGNGAVDVFLYERATGTVTLVSHVPGSASTSGNGESLGLGLDISADGAFVAFDSAATNLVTSQADANGGQDVFLLERSTGNIMLASHVPESMSTTGNSSSIFPDMSADGRYLYFASGATDLVAGQVDNTSTGDAFMFDRASGMVTLISHVPGSSSTTANSSSGTGAISADGAFVVFGSQATNIVPGQNDAGSSDVFLFEQATGIVTLVSHLPGLAGTTANNDSYTISGSSRSNRIISDDGGFLVLESLASNLVSGQTEPGFYKDVFMFERVPVAAVPGSPSNVVAVPGDGAASVSWSAPTSDGGSPITGYTVTASPGGASVDVGGATTTTVVTGLSNGTTYTFTVVATNAIGDSAASSPSAGVTPITASTTTTIQSGTTTSSTSASSTTVPATTTTTTTATTNTTSTTTTVPNGATGPARVGEQGYALVGADGGVFNFGTARFFGSTGAIRLNRPMVAMDHTPSTHGYWLVGSDGGVFAFGDARFFGSTGAIRLNSPIVGMERTPTGRGYWLVAADGGVFAFGDARFLGSTGATRLNSPIVGIEGTSSGDGYWLVAADGGIFAFGDARFLGSTGATRPNSPIVGMGRTNSNGGYHLVAADGGIFAFGDAVFRGSMGATRLNSPIVAMSPIASGGYWLCAADGGVFAFGNAQFRGSMGAARLNSPIVGCDSPRRAVIVQVA